MGFCSYESKSELISVEQLIEDVYILSWEEGVEKFEIVETFKDKTHYYIVCGLNVEYENGAIYCSDIYNMIYKNGYTLMGLLNDNIINITRTISTNERCGIIQLKDGQVIIKVIYE